MASCSAFQEAFATASNPLQGLKSSRGENWIFLKSVGVLPPTSKERRFPLGSLKKEDKKKHLGRAAALSQRGQANPRCGPSPSLTGNVPAAHFHKKLLLWIP